MGKRLNFRSARSDRDRKNMEVAAKQWIKKKHPTFDGDVYVENIRCFLDISQEELEKRKCTGYDSTYFQPETSGSIISAMPYAQAKRNARGPGIERFVRNVQQDL